MKSTGVELWNKAKTIIPGGNQLLSKRAELYVPGQWPAYYKRAKGCEVWDLDDRKYYDFADMGVGSCTLGYANEAVNAAVKEAIDQSSMCTLNCYEEVELAETLIGLHPWAEMARFSRTGGEACSIAIRIARAATGKSKVVFCGYHGWHDWYIAANIGSDKNLDEQLLPGLKPTGVPRELYNTALPFRYNNIEEFREVIGQNKGDVAAIIMEPQRDDDPAPGFLEEIRETATKEGIVLIFDEVTSGFRMNTGGIHMTMKVYPDMAVFGKALGNGFPISAIIGTRQVMDAAQDSFISSTFWTERIGYTAALATIRQYQEQDIPSQLIKWGDAISGIWNSAAAENRIPVHVSGVTPLTTLSFAGSDAKALQTLYSQELLDKGFLLGASVFTTAAYNETVMDLFDKATHEAFKTLREALDEGDVKAKLRGDVKHSKFARLT